MNLARSLGSVGGLTLVSRVLALVRDTLQASYVGASFASDAFFVAFRLPNMFRALFAEGAFSAAFIPMFNRKVGEADDVTAGMRFAEQTLAVLLPVLLVFTVLMLIFAWPITWGLSGGFKNPTHEQFAFAVMLSRITIPYLMLISLASLLGGILNSLHKFWVNAAAPILLNIAMIVALWFFHGSGPEGAYVTARAQAISVTIGGALQLAWLMLACKQAGVSLAIKRPRMTDDLRQLLRLILPAALGAGAVQVNLAVSTAPEPAPARAHRDRPWHHPAADCLTPAEPKARRRSDGHAEPRRRAGAVPDSSGDCSFRVRIRADHPRPVPARPFHRDR
jgi:putative peptidoglycan lipid II flippase